LSLDAVGPRLQVTVGGVWTIADGLTDIAAFEQALTAADAIEPIKTVEVVGQDLERADSALGVYLCAVHDRCERAGITLDLSRSDPGLARLVGLARAVPEQEGTGRDDRHLSQLEKIGQQALRSLHEADDQMRFIGEFCQGVGRLAAGRARFRWCDVMEVVNDCGPRALTIVTVIAALVGMIMAFIGAVQLRRFGAGIYVADLVGLAMTREMAAVMTAIVIAGNIGAAFAARIGTMQANEEVDALTTLGLSPIDFLVLPRVIGLALMMPLLYAYACAVSLAGGMLVGTMVLDLSMIQYWHQTQLALKPTQFAIGLSKSLVFGVLVALAGCMRGIQCGRSAAAVGEATTSAVVTGILYIIITDAVFAVLLEVYKL
jgi:phospholipid/cholesterol/gamma-HCH transport system permease protein